MAGIKVSGMLAGTQKLLRELICEFISSTFPMNLTVVAIVRERGFDQKNAQTAAELCAP
jgi:hypothetical protein